MKNIFNAIGLVSGFVGILSADGILQYLSISLVVVLTFIFLYPLVLRVEQVSNVDAILSVPFKACPASKDEIYWIAEKAKTVYTGIDIIPLKLMLEWYDKNPTGFFVIKDSNNKIWGNLDILPLKEETLELFMNGSIIERDIKNISIYSKNESHQIKNLYIESIVTFNPLATYRFIMASSQIIKNICNPAQIENIYAIAASKSGIRLIQKLGFNIVKSASDRKDSHSLYSISFKTLSGNLAEIASSVSDKIEILKMIKDVSVDQTL